MSATYRSRARVAAIDILKATLLATSLVGIASTAVNAQEAIGLPFVGKNHLSFYTTELSRDGIGQERASIFGGVYGRTFGDGQGAAQLGMILHAGARGFDELDDGILDAGATLTATRSVPGLDRLSLTAAAGVGAMAWGHGSAAAGEPGTGRLSVRVPLSAGMAYNVRAGRATIAPFVALTTAYSSERDYEDDQRVASDSGWRVGSATGVSVRFSELVLSVSDVRGERGLPHDHRVVFNVGISW